MTAKSVPRDERWRKKISINLKVVINSTAFGGFELLSLVRPGRIHPTKKISQHIFSIEYFHFRNRELIFVPRTRKLDLIRKSPICSSNIGSKLDVWLFNQHNFLLAFENNKIKLVLKPFMFGVTEETEGVCIKTPENDPLNWRSQGRSYIAYKLDCKRSSVNFRENKSTGVYSKRRKVFFAEMLQPRSQGFTRRKKLWERGWNFCWNPISC